MTVLDCSGQVSALLVGLRHLLRWAGFHLGRELTQTWFSVLSDVAIQPGGQGGDQIVAKRDSFPCNGGDQVVDRRERLADTDGDVDAVTFASGEMWGGY